MRILTLIAGIALLAAACGSSSPSTAENSDAICELARTQALLDGDDDTMAADLDPFIEVAPGSLRSDLIKVQELFADLEEIEATEGDEAAFAAALASGNDPELEAAFTNLDQFFTGECGLEGDGTASSGAGDSAGSVDGTAGADIGSCPEAGFTGTISSDGDDANSAFTLESGDVALVQAFALSRGANYTIYLADYDLGDQQVGADTIEADPGQVVVTVFVGTPGGEPIVIGEPYEATFVIMDSGGGASGLPDDPMGTATFGGVTNDRVCFDFDFSDTGQVLSGTISAEVVGGF